MKLKKVFVCFLAAIMIMVPASVLFAAADTVQLEMKTYIWEDSNSHIEKSEFESGDILTICVKTNSAVNVGALVLNLTYDTSKFKYVESSAKYLGVDENVSLSVYEATKGTLSVIYDTSTKNSQINGEFMVLSFTVLTIKEESTSNFELKVKEAWDSTNNYNKLNVSAGTVSVNLKNVDVPEEFIKLISSTLKTIDINSATAIAKAEDEFKKLTKQQQSMFKTSEKYSEEYKLFTTAKSRYHECVEKAELDKLDDAADAFIKNNPILKKKLSKVTMADEEAISSLSSAYAALDPRIKNRISKKYVEKIASLEEALEAVGQVSEFKNSYNYLLKADKEALITDATIILPMVNEAIVVYGTCNSMAQERLADEYKYLLSLKKTLEEAIGLSEQQAAIQEEAAAYQLIWLKVLSKNVNNVSLEDKVAIELAIAEYAKLSEGAQEYLKDKYENLVKMLALLNNYEEITPETPQQSVNGETQTVVTETVKTVTETKDNVITKYLSSVSKHRIWLLILLLIASLGAAYAYIHYEHLRKKYLVDSVAQIEINDLEDDDE